MPTITLDQIREDVEKKYEPLVVEFGEGQSVTLVQSLRLPKATRASLEAKVDEFNGIQARVDENAKARAEASDPDDAPEVFDAEEEMLTIISDVFTLAASNKRDAAAFLKAAGGDFTVLVEVLKAYTSASQLGEASPSAE